MMPGNNGYQYLSGIENGEERTFNSIVKCPIFKFSHDFDHCHIIKTPGVFIRPKVLRQSSSDATLAVF